LPCAVDDRLYVVRTPHIAGQSNRSDRVRRGKVGSSRFAAFCLACAEDEVRTRLRKRFGHLAA
jgi:hypothetical protein